MMREHSKVITKWMFRACLSITGHISLVNSDKQTYMSVYYFDRLTQLPDGRMVMQWIANPFTLVRFQFGYPILKRPPPPKTEQSDLT